MAEAIAMRTTTTKASSASKTSRRIWQTAGTSPPPTEDSKRSSAGDSNGSAKSMHEPPRQMTENQPGMTDRPIAPARLNGRDPESLRTLDIIANVAPYAEGSALIKLGNTHVLCTATVEERVPGWLRG